MPQVVRNDSISVRRVLHAAARLVRNSADEKKRGLCQTSDKENARNAGNAVQLSLNGIVVLMARRCCKRRAELLTFRRDAFQSPDLSAR
ncbi:hypothetical protein, partial [Paraburkholderia unamae]